jgi:hypothetical protein
VLRRTNRRSTSLDIVEKTLGALFPMWVRRRGPFWVTSGKTPSEYMFSELPQVADIVRSAFDHLANPLVLQITAFWARAFQAEL